MKGNRMTKARLKTKAKSTNVRDRLFVKNLLSAFFKMAWMVWPTATEKLALRLFFSPVRYPLNPAEKLLLDQGRPFQITVRNKKVQCWQWGDGPIVILAHGLWAVGCGPVESSALGVGYGCVKQLCGPAGHRVLRCRELQ